MTEWQIWVALFLGFLLIDEAITNLGRVFVAKYSRPMDPPSDPPQSLPTKDQSDGQV